MVVPDRTSRSQRAPLLPLPSRSAVKSHCIRTPRSVSWTDAYEVVATLRPNWLADRGRDSFGSGTVVQVVMNGVRMGGVTSLRRVPATEVEHFQYYSATSATTRWGVGFGKGAIELSTTPAR